MGKLIQKTLNFSQLNSPMNTTSDSINSVITFKQLESKIPVEIIKEVKVIEEKIIEVPKEVIKYIDREIEVIKEVPVEVIKYIDREVEKVIHVPVEKIQEVEKKIVSVVHKVPSWCWITMGIELLLITLAIIK